LVPPTATPATSAGLDWQAFEGTFPWVPDFTAIAPAAEGVCPGLDCAVLARGGRSGLLFTGYLDVPADGTYTLYLVTDGRAFLRVHEASVIDADFGYHGGERSANINLKAGYHPIRLAYVRGRSGAPSLTLEWSGAELAKGPVPASAFRHAVLSPGKNGR
jgi:hypothetical protein